MIAKSCSTTANVKCGAVQDSANLVDLKKLCKIKDLFIEKNDFSGPGRLRLDFSSAEGIVVKEKRNDGSSFTFKNNEALFIWYDLPNEKNIEITYVISANENVTGMKKIIGDFQ